MALALAEAARAPAHDDVPVGAVVLDREGRVIGTGHNRREVDEDPLGHAELLALRQAAATTGRWRLDGCTLVVTLEPCAMCAGALIGARVARLVFGAFDEKAGAVGSVWDLPRDRAALHHPEVYSGVQESAAAALLTDFFTAKRGT
ncbi:nucleoside deaminase [Brevibacterium casei]|uniref:tRNA-specific adenosine deaminase n=1 Tax=Brevibacterium casei TaxID=33889 RepID=A0A7T4DJN2_9MICO|nr:nucleoside deaminase [Brevibacterium casei]QQB15635.1 nucleoside deaminase [Brevibacterium casei]